MYANRKSFNSGEKYEESWDLHLYISTNGSHYSLSRNAGHVGGLPVKTPMVEFSPAPSFTIDSDMVHRSP